MARRCVNVTAFLGEANAATAASEEKGFNYKVMYLLGRDRSTDYKEVETAKAKFDKTKGKIEAITKARDCKGTLETIRKLEAITGTLGTIKGKRCHPRNMLKFSVWCSQ
jgi:hypothetical protein